MTFRDGWLRKPRSAVATQNGTEHGDATDGKKNSMQQLQQGKTGAGSLALAPPHETVRPERFGDKQHECKNEPDDKHGMHPPESDVAEAIPQIEREQHVKAAGAHDQDGSARLPSKAPLDGVE